MFDRWIMLLLTGCVGTIVCGFIWEKREGTGSLVWSDDGTRVARVDTSFEITANADPPLIPGRVRNSEYHIFTRNLDGSAKQSLLHRTARPPVCLCPVYWGRQQVAARSMREGNNFRALTPMARSIPSAATATDLPFNRLRACSAHAPNILPANHYCLARLVGC
jgi:hypothetical protein